MDPFAFDALKTTSAEMQIFDAGSSTAVSACSICTSAGGGEQNFAMIGPSTNGPEFPFSDNHDGVQPLRLEAPDPLAIPEPATWGLMLPGFFGAGALLRARRKAVMFAAG